MRLLAGVFQRRFRGFRIVDLVAFGCLTVLVLGVYAFKAHAGGQSARVGDVDSQITDEQRRIRVLNAELAHLEQPERLERLSGQVLGLAPVPAKHETTPDSLMEIARQASAPAGSVQRAGGAQPTTANAAPTTPTPRSPAATSSIPASPVPAPSAPAPLNSASAAPSVSAPQ